MERKTLCLATQNPNKVEEIKPYLSSIWDITCSKDYPQLEEIEETGDTFLSNAQIKAVTTSQILDKEIFVLADDSGLEVDVLDGAPGVFSARYGGIPSSTEKNNAKLLEELKRLGATTPQQLLARYRCVLALAQGGEIKETFEGTCEGIISLTPKGTNGFGYDPLFIPQGYARTFGQLSERTKGQLSHRALALKKFISWCKEHQNN